MFIWGGKKRMLQREATEFTTPQHPSLDPNNQRMWQREVPVFRTPQHPSSATNKWGTRQKEPLEFRTPQHPSSGTSNRLIRLIGIPEFRTLKHQSSRTSNRTMSQGQLVEFRTPQHPSLGTINRGMRLRQLLEFRTPQHPSSGTNNWGGSSPLLARDIPKESLEQRYRRLNGFHIHDEIFFDHEDVSMDISQGYTTPKHQNGAKQSRSKSRFSLRLILPRKKKAELGSGSKKKKWFPRWDPQNRWPQGWG